MEKSNQEIIEGLSSPSMIRFIRDHEQDDERSFVLKHRQVAGIPSAVIADQIAGRRKAKEKLPLFYQTPGIVYPPAVSLEQSSSEKTAQYKTSIVRILFPTRRASGADITGGFGVDAYFLSKAFNEFHYVEPRPDLLHLAAHNHTLLGAGNITHHLFSAEDFMHSIQRPIDFVFADPSRRSEARKKQFSLRDSGPDITSLKKEIFQKSTILLVKASPLLDIQEGVKQLQNVNEVFIISVSNECKEVLFLCKKDFTGIPLVQTVNLIEPNREQILKFTFSEEREAKINFSDPLQYLYEPNASILKAGAFKSVSRQFNLNKIDKSTHLYTSQQLVKGFPGRTFFIEDTIKPDAASLRKYFPEGKANVATRNYPLSADELKKKTGLEDGGDKYLIGFSGPRKKYLVVASRLVGEG